VTLWWNDLLYTLRQLRKSPGFTFTAVLVLTLGIGATVTMFSLVYCILLRPLPYHNPSHLFMLSDRLQGVETGNESREVGVTGPDIAAYKRNTHVFSSLGAFRYIWPMQLAEGGQTVPLETTPMDAEMFPTLGVSPLMGRVFTEQDIEQNQQVVILRYFTWKKTFNGDPKIIGRKIILDRSPYIVIGVMPRNFELPLHQGHLDLGGIWIPLHLTPEERTKPGWRGFEMVGRLKPGITAAQAQADANRVVRETIRSYPANMASLHVSAVVRPLLEELTGQARPLIQTLFLAICVVLLIACANLAGLLLVRAIRRRRETAVRLALGSSAGSLVRQALLESLALSVAGGLLGIGLAFFALRICVRLLPDSMPRIDNVSLNWPVVAFAILLVVATGAISALAPALAAIHTNMNDSLKEGGQGDSIGGGHRRLRSALVIAEIAVAMVLVVASGLLLRSFQNMENVDLGFNPEHVIVGIYTLPKQRYATQADVDTFRTTFLQKLQQFPGLESFGLTSYFPESFGGGDTGFETFAVDGYVPPKGASADLATVAVVEGNYFSAIGLSLRRGRLFTDEDTDKSQLVAIVNRKLAERYWPGQNPLGKRLSLGTDPKKTPWLTVVGEVNDVKQGGPDRPTSEQFYLPLKQFHAAVGSMVKATDPVDSQMSVILRTLINPALMKHAIRNVVHSIDPQLALSEVEGMDEAVAETQDSRRFITTLTTAFAFVAVLLAILGIYSVIAFTVALRTHEMAIRMALGSSRLGVIRVILGSAARLTLIGCAIGMVGAAGASHLLAAQLFQVGPYDPLVLIGAVVVILALSLAASFLPARRVSSIDPMQALRSE
jgi:putative ABC transport system permease protein